MPRFRNAIRIALLAVLAAASLNGIMVFLFFDGTNFYGHLFSLQAKAQAGLDAKRIRELEGRVEEERAEAALDRLRMEKSLRKEYAHLDTALRNADILFRRPFPKRELETKFRADHPFRVGNGKIAICSGGECFYEEMLPRYPRLELPTPHSSRIAMAALTAFRDKAAGSPGFAFILARKSGPVEMWIAYRELDDSTYAYHSAYLMDLDKKRLMKRGESPDRELPP